MCADTAVITLCTKHPTDLVNNDACARAIFSRSCLLLKKKTRPEAQFWDELSRASSVSSRTFVKSQRTVQTKRSEFIDASLQGNITPTATLDGLFIVKIYCSLHHYSSGEKDEDGAFPRCAMWCSCNTIYVWRLTVQFRLIKGCFHIYLLIAVNWFFIRVGEIWVMSEYLLIVLRSY